MIGAIKKLYWDLADKTGREVWKEYFIRNIPRQFGLHIRGHFYRRLFSQCGENLQVMPGTFIINPQLIQCGDNFLIGVHSYIQAGGGLKCGDNVMLGPYAKIWTQNHVFVDPEKPTWKQGYEYKEVIIGNDVWLGANAFVMPGAIIGDKCVIAANSVVGAKHYKEGMILAGNPARKIGER